MSDESVGHGLDETVGKIGRVSVPVAPGVAGEVIIQIRGGSEAFTAYTQGEEPLAVNSRVVVVEQLSARTVLVTGF